MFDKSYIGVHPYSSRAEVEQNKQYREKLIDVVSNPKLKVALVPAKDAEWFSDLVRISRRNPSELLIVGTDILSPEPVGWDWEGLSREILSEYPSRGYTLFGSQNGFFNESEFSNYGGFVGAAYEAFAKSGILPGLRVDKNSCRNVDAFGKRRFYKP